MLLLSPHVFQVISKLIYSTSISKPGREHTAARRPPLYLDQDAVFLQHLGFSAPSRWRGKVGDAESQPLSLPAHDLR